MFEIDAEVPPGNNEITIEFDDTFAIGTLFGEIGSATLCRVKWNRLVWFPGPLSSDSIQVAASITLPKGWSMAIALDVAKKDDDTLSFKGGQPDPPGRLSRGDRSVFQELRCHRSEFGETHTGCPGRKPIGNQACAGIASEDRPHS
jgi:hypothetical protein